MLGEERPLVLHRQFVQRLPFRLFGIGIAAGQPRQGLLLFGGEDDALARTGIIVAPGVT